jgi:hypothetical protein
LRLAKRSDLSKKLGRGFAIDISQAVIPAGLFHDRDGLFHNREEASWKDDEESPSQQREVARTKNLALKSRVLCGG